MCTFEQGQLYNIKCKNTFCSHDDQVEKVTQTLGNSSLASLEVESNHQLVTQTPIHPHSHPHARTHANARAHIFSFHAEALILPSAYIAPPRSNLAYDNSIASIARYSG